MTGFEEPTAQQQTNPIEKQVSSGLEGLATQPADFANFNEPTPESSNKVDGQKEDSESDGFGDFGDDNGNDSKEKEE